MTNREWISKGNTGCVFATLFSKSPEIVGWKFINYTDFKKGALDGALLVSVEFPENWTLDVVRQWAFIQGFYEESTGEKTLGLRIKSSEGVSWVQYFGPDSHVVTRQSPKPMLMYTQKLNKSYYIKVGFKGVLHLAHAWYDKISPRVYDLLWDRSHKQTKKRIGHELGIEQAAKTSWLKSNL